MIRRFLLGPQLAQATLPEALRRLAPDGPLALITAGWRDTEGEVAELQELAAQPLDDLMLYHRADEVFAREPALHALQRERQEQLAELQRLYRLRLGPALHSALALLRATGVPELLRLEQRAAISQLRALDRHHLRCIAALHAAFDTRRAELDAPFATAQREAVHQRLGRAAVVLIAGGHIAVLLNRIRLFRLEPLLAARPVIAWSAGAMALGERIVLFHENTPHGPRDPEVLDTGLGMVRRLLPLPDAHSRLAGADPHRLALLSRRFAPAACATLDGGAVLEVGPGGTLAAHGVAMLQRTGRRRRLVPR